MVMAGRGNGGLESHVVQLANALSARGLRISVIADGFHADRFEASVEFHAFDINRNRRNPLMLWSMRRLLHRLRPDIIHAQANKPIGILRRLKPFGLPGRLTGTVHNLKGDAYYLHLDTVICVSDGVLRDVRHPRRQLIYNGLAERPSADADIARLRAGFGDPQRPLALAVGRLVRAKGFHDLIAAWKPAFGRLLIVGDGPLRASLQAAIATAGKSACVTLIGHRNDVPALMAAADLLVIASHREGFSYVMAEALLGGLPIVSTDVPAPNEIIPSRFLVPVADVGRLSATLASTLARLPELKTEYRQTFDWARAHLTEHGMVEATAQHYASLLRTA